MRILLPLLIIFSSSVAFSKLNNTNLAELSESCYKQYSKNKKFPQICDCQKLNLRWLLDDSDWKYAKKLYTSQMSQVEINSIEGLTATDTMIVDIEIACDKNAKYLAPKAKRLIKESKK